MISTVLVRWDDSAIDLTGWGWVLVSLVYLSWLIYMSSKYPSRQAVTGDKAALPPEETSQRLMEAISQCVNGVVTGYVVVASFMDNEGKSNIFGESMENQVTHQTMGLLAFAWEQVKGDAAEAEDV